MSKQRVAKSNSKKDRVWNKTHGHCHLCGERLNKADWQIDHLVPRERGGADEDWNLLPICGFCNRMKKAATEYKMRRILMYGRYCLDEAAKRDYSDAGKTIHQVVRRRVRVVKQRSASQAPHYHLWKHAPKKHA